MTHKIYKLGMAVATFVLLVVLLGAISVAYYMAQRHIESFKPAAFEAALVLHETIQYMAVQGTPGISVTVTLLVPDGGFLVLCREGSDYVIKVGPVYADVGYLFRDHAGIMQKTQNPYYKYYKLKDGIMSLIYSADKIEFAGIGVCGSKSQGSVLVLNGGRNVLTLRSVDVRSTSVVVIEIVNLVADRGWVAG